MTLPIATEAKRQKRKRPEEALQAQVCKFLASALTGNSWFTAIPLGGGGRMRGAALKRTGTKSGTPDLLVLNDGRAIWFELKAERRVVSDAQLYCHQQIRRASCAVFVCKTLDEVIAGLLREGVPLRINDSFLSSTSY